MSLTQEDLDAIAMRVTTANRSCNVTLKRGAKGETIIEVSSYADTVDKAAEDAKRVYTGLCNTFNNN